LPPMAACSMGLVVLAFPPAPFLAPLLGGLVLRREWRYRRARLMTVLGVAGVVGTVILALPPVILIQSGIYAGADMWMMVLAGLLATVLGAMAGWLTTMLAYGMKQALWARLEREIGRRLRDELETPEIGDGRGGTGALCKSR